MFLCISAATHLADALYHAAACEGFNLPEPRSSRLLIRKIEKQQLKNAQESRGKSPAEIPKWSPKTGSSVKSLALAKDLPPAMDIPCLVMDGKSAVAIASNVLPQLPEEEAEKQEGPGHLPDDTTDPELTQEDPEKQKSPPRRPGYV
ncbi:MAG: hypothetical protein GY696_07225, partial [Gammaproteobacteria bacterium]|nr:hypothetical protein [Gammaproteobacteria bacterium]